MRLHRKVTGRTRVQLHCTVCGRTGGLTMIVCGDTVYCPECLRELQQMQATLAETSPVQGAPKLAEPLLVTETDARIPEFSGGGTA